MSIPRRTLLGMTTGNATAGPSVDQAHREEQETQPAFDLERLAEEEAQRGREQEEEQQRQTLYASLERASPTVPDSPCGPPPNPPKARRCNRLLPCSARYHLLLSLCALNVGWYGLG